MPIHIDELLGKRDEDLEYINEYLMNMIYSSHPDNYSGSIHGLDHNIATVAFNIPDKLSKETVMRCVFTLKADEDSGALDVLDVDMVMTTDEICEVDFKLELEDHDIAGYWLAAKDGALFETESVNSHIIEGELNASPRKASFSAFPFRYLFGDSLEELNLKLGWKKEENGPLRFPEDFISTCEAFPRALGERFSVLMCKILSYRKVLLEVEEKDFEGIIATAQTALGKIPVFIDPDYEKEIRINGYMLIFADLKADLAVEDKYYYDKSDVSDISDEDREKLKQYLQERDTEEQ